MLFRNCNTNIQWQTIPLRALNMYDHDTHTHEHRSAVCLSCIVRYCVPFGCPRCARLLHTHRKNESEIARYQLFLSCTTSTQAGSQRARCARRHHRRRRPFMYYIIWIWPMQENWLDRRKKKTEETTNNKEKKKKKEVNKCAAARCLFRLSRRIC